jgi:hypothetical protein
MNDAVDDAAIVLAREPGLNRRKMRRDRGPFPIAKPKNRPP